MRPLTRWLALMGLAAALGAGVVAGGTNATATASARGSYPQLLTNFEFIHIHTNGAVQQWNTFLEYDGGNKLEYRQLRPKDMIPLVWLTFSLPDGMTLTKYQIGNGGWNYDSNHGGKPIPKTNLVLGHRYSQHPVWRWRQLDEVTRPGVALWLTSTATDPSQRCFSVKAQFMYFKKVRRHGRIRKVRALIPHAPPQTAQACLQ